MAHTKATETTDVKNVDAKLRGFRLTEAFVEGDCDVWAIVIESLSLLSRWG